MTVASDFLDQIIANERRVRALETRAEPYWRDTSRGYEFGPVFPTLLNGWSSYRTIAYGVRAGHFYAVGAGAKALGGSATHAFTVFDTTDRQLRPTAETRGVVAWYFAATSGPLDCYLTATGEMHLPLHPAEDTTVWFYVTYPLPKP